MELCKNCGLYAGTHVCDQKDVQILRLKMAMNAQQIRVNTLRKRKKCTELRRLLTFARGIFKEDPNNEKGVILYNAEGEDIRTWLAEVDKML